MWGVLDTSGEVWLETHDDDHLLTLTQTVTYTGSIRDELSNISCVVTQTLDTGHTNTQVRSVSVQILSSSALRNSGNFFINKVGLASLILVSLIAVILVLVIVTIMVLRRRCGKQTIYRPVFSCSSDVFSSGSMSGTHPRLHNISYIDLYSHCANTVNTAPGDNKLLPNQNDVSPGCNCPTDS